MIPLHGKKKGKTKKFRFFILSNENGTLMK
jgi:hypothetical protein